MSEVVEKRKAPPKTGIRHVTPVQNLEVRAVEDGSGNARFSGYAILWDDPTTIYDWLGSFTEQFRKGAFSKTIAERGPQGNGQIKFLRQHDSWVAVGAKFHELVEDNIGLRFDAETIGTTTGRDLAEEVREGVIDTVSIGFDAIKEEWDAEAEERVVLEARLFEISAVLWPAYPNAKITSVRAFDRMGAYMDALLTELREGKVLSQANFTKLTEARDRLNEVIASAQPEPDEDPLEENALDVEFALREAELNLKGVAPR